jgi:hypothetical protein
MTIRAAAATTLLAAAVLAAPGAAAAATLKLRPVQACYGTADRVSLVGAGFTPSRSVNVLRDGKILNRRNGKIKPIVIDGAGRFAVVATVPDLTRAVQTSTYSAIDRANRANRASLRVRLSDLAVTIKPDDAATDRPRRIRARGFTVRGKTLYGHVVRKGTRRTFRVGRLEGGCKTASAVRRLFGKNATRGTYRVQFDTFKKYKPTRAQRIRFSITIRRVTRSAAAGVAAVTSQARVLAIQT